ncbi:PLP-dependent aminotransferase family protein [Pontibacterium sp. N1Y112]|jgi:GntR family transcriptional regulator/MocR family aminotransferase|uniref:PLP-dependent aminotransferase family protein n=1 Tax=Pontibacterium sinense TaxID=2781979 RepID=A0A8J7FL39_9GAMM|nr:PLP-dependent aminotransferase family protein [Pontibacterium sinense]MBE9398203.1 PLP-dependent aminotransferase family protein [Pontibacterium sinense]
MFQLFHLTPGKGGSLQQQLREQIATAILNGNIPVDAPLPSSRKLAQQLDVARNTVVLAYEHLLDDGYLIARERSGYYVNPDILSGQVTLAEQPESDTRGEPTHPPIWSKRFKLNPTDQTNICKPRDWQKYEYPFIYGQFDASLFPTVNWRECCRDAVSGPSISDWAADRFDNDDPLLVEQIRTRLLPRRGVWASSDQILVTVGAQQALYILAQLLLDKQSTIGLENPGYVDIRNIAKLNPSQVRPIPVDKDGMLVDDRLKGCDLVFTTPSHQCPTTVTMPIERRYELLKRADEDDFVIIEDDYESETNFKSNPIPALKSLDKNDRVLYIGSLSKTLAPGLRVGYLVGPAEFIREARALRRLMVRHPAANNQRSVALFLERGYHDSLIMNIMRNYQTRWRAMDEALTRHLPESHDQPTFGGSCYWVKGPEGLDTDELQKRAKEESILIEPGAIHFLQEPAPKNYFRLGYSSISTDRIEPGIKKLAELIHSMV